LPAGLDHRSCALDLEAIAPLESVDRLGGLGVVIAAQLLSISCTSPAAGSAPSSAMSAEASIRVVVEDSAASVAVALLDIQFLFAIQALSVLRAEHADLRRECPYSGGNWII
jgi:hypothetical protein